MRAVLLLLSLFWLSACATNNSNPFVLHQINALGSAASDDGTFQGLEFIAETQPDTLKSRVNILYLHGIGYTEDRTASALASDFLGGVAKAYDLDAGDGVVTALCGEAENHIYLKADRPVALRTILPDSQLQIDRLACLDKQVLDAGDGLEIALYRVFWDNVFWDTLQYPHVGQDDDRGTSSETARLRRKYNRVLKDDLVNYGFSDAVMYLGAGGALIREAVSGAMCAAARDAAGEDFGRIAGRIGGTVSTGSACLSATSQDFAPFVFVTESLGSKVMFDVMRERATDGVGTVHDTLIAGSSTFMLANQLALFGLSDLSEQQMRMPDLGADRPTLVAISDVNDFLSYEIVPFLEQLYSNSYRPGGVAGSLAPQAREAVAREFGFDVIDMRVDFADRIIPIVGSFVDPKDAHTGHAREPELMRFILCGAENGELKREGCLAARAVEDAE